MANVKEIEWRGGIYNIADETARGEAQQARALANTAQATADTAQTTADTAQTTANTAQTTADTAQTTADTAKNTADDVSTQFTNYKKLESASVKFAETGVVIFNKRGNICQISIKGRIIPAGKYTVQIPSGFAPLTEGFSPNFLLIDGRTITGNCLIMGDSISIYVNDIANISAQQTFLM